MARAVGSGCGIVQQPWKGYVGMHRWNWTYGPFGEVSPLASSGEHPSVGGMPSLQAAASGYIPAAATAQAGPAIALRRAGKDVPPESALYPPTRSVEPWTEEQWFYYFPDVNNPYEFVSGGLVTSGYWQWVNTTVFWPPATSTKTVPNWAPYLFMADPGWQWAYYPLSTGVQMSYQYAYAMRHARYIMHHVTCRREIYSEACTPMDQPIAPNDTCRQATLWPDLSYSGYIKGDIRAPPGHEPNCSGAPPVGTELANHTSFLLDESYIDSITAASLSEVIEWYGAPASGIPEHGAGMYNRWHQVVTVTYPPGTVAILPVDGEDLVNHGLPSHEYPWRLNHVHVTQVIVDSVPVETPERASSVLFAPGLYCEASGAKVLVLLDDLSCVSSQSCAPTASNTSSGNQSHWSASGVTDATQAWSRKQLSLPPWRREARLACAVQYYVNTTEFNADLMHFDYPAASMERAVTVGGEFRRDYSPTDGLWHAEGKALNDGPSHLPLYDSQRNESQDSNPSWYVPTTVSPLQGPFARYRGARLDRIVPPDPESSLPRVLGGRWECGDTSPVGAYRYRPVCRAVCDEGSRIAVDAEHEASSHYWNGWRLDASISRVWNSYWTGQPALGSACSARSARGSIAFAPLGCEYIYPSAAEHVLSCEPDKGALLVPDTFQSRWAQREPASHAFVSFTLAFDQNMWPRAQMIGPDRLGYGLSYPDPESTQLSILEIELTMDIRDVMAEWSEDNSSTNSTGIRVSGGVSSDRMIEVRVLQHRALQPMDRNCSRRDPLSPDSSPVRRIEPLACSKVLPVEIDVQVVIHPVLQTAESMYRGRSAGSVAQRLVHVLRGESEGGVWLPVVDAGSVRANVELPCLRGGRAASVWQCHGSSVHAGVWLWAYCVASGMVWVLALMSWCGVPWARCSRLLGVEGSDGVKLLRMSAPDPSLTMRLMPTLMAPSAPYHDVSDEGIQPVHGTEDRSGADAFVGVDAVGLAVTEAREIMQPYELGILSTATERVSRSSDGVVTSYVGLQSQFNSEEDPSASITRHMPPLHDGQRSGGHGQPAGAWVDALETSRAEPVAPGACASMDDERNIYDSGSMVNVQSVFAASSSDSSGAPIRPAEDTTAIVGNREILWVLLSWRFVSLAVLAASMAAARLSVCGLILLGGLVAGLCIKGTLLCVHHGVCKRRLRPSVAPAAGRMRRYLPPRSPELRASNGRHPYGSKDRLYRYENEQTEGGDATSNFADMRAASMMGGELDRSLSCDDSDKESATGRDQPESEKADGSAEARSNTAGVGVGVGVGVIANASGGGGTISVVYGRENLLNSAVSPSSLICQHLLALMAWEWMGLAAVVRAGRRRNGEEAGHSKQWKHDAFWLSMVQNHAVLVRLVEDLSLVAAVCLGGWCTAQATPGSMCDLSARSPLELAMDGRLWWQLRLQIVGAPLVGCGIGLLLSVWAGCRALCASSNATL